GFQAVVLVGKPLACTAEAVDDLIENEQHAVAAADVLYGLPILRRRDQHADAALDGFHDDRSHGIRAFGDDGLLQGPRRSQLGRDAANPKGAAVRVRRRHVDETVAVRAKAPLALGDPAYGQGGEAGAVIREVAADELVAGLMRAHLALVLPGQLHGGLVGLGAAVDEVHVAQAPARQVGQLVGQYRRGTVDLQVWVIRQLQHLLVHGVRDLPPPVADVDAPQARHGVQVLAPFGVDDGRAVGPLDH